MLLRVFCWVCFSVSVLASEPLFNENDVRRADFLRESVRRDNKAYAIVESLTTEVGARTAGSAGDARAVEWARNKFVQLNFDKVWIEPVSFPTWQRGIEQAQVLSPFPQPLHITALGNSVGTGDTPLQAAIVHFPTLADLEQATVEQVKGKIVFISRKMERFKDGAGYGPVVAARSKGSSVASAKGATAFLMRSVGTDHDRLPHTGNMNYQLDVTKIPAAAVSNPDADLLLNMLRRGKDVVVQLNMSSSTQKTYTSHNVIGQINGSEKPDEYVLIGGHLDSWDLGTGALDDGAGVAITMAAAESIKRLGLKPKRSIRVVLFANEEQGLYGGQQYYDLHKNEMEKIVAAAEADFGAGPVYAFASKVRSSSFGAVMQMAEALKPLDIRYVGNQADNGPDLRALIGGGVALFDLSLDGSDYFDYHHTANDTLDKIDPDDIAQSTAAYAVFVWLAAQSPSGFGSGHLTPAKVN